MICDGSFSLNSFILLIIKLCIKLCIRIASHADSEIRLFGEFNSMIPIPHRAIFDVLWRRYINSCLDDRLRFEFGRNAIAFLYNRTLIILVYPCYIILSRLTSRARYDARCFGIWLAICRWIYLLWNGKQSPFTVKNLFPARFTATARFTANARFTACLTVMTRPCSMRVWGFVAASSPLLKFLLPLFLRCTTTSDWDRAHRQTISIVLFCSTLSVVSRALSWKFVSLSCFFLVILIIKRYFWHYITRLNCV